MKPEEEVMINDSVRDTLQTQKEQEQSQNTDQEKSLQSLIQKINGEGRYQFLTFLLFCLLWFLGGMILLGQGFFFDDEYTCFNLEDKQECERFICSLPKEERDENIDWHENSIVFAFPEHYLICQQDYLVPVLTSLVYFGSLIGFFVIPFIADNWGRKITMLISWIFFVIGILTISIADSPNMIGMGQFFAGFGCNPAITLCYSFINEQCSGKSRQFFGIAIQVFLAIGQCVIAFLFLPQIDWRYLMYIFLGLTVLALILMTYLVESPKFLIMRDKKKTLEVLNIIAKRNKRKPITEEQLNQIKIEQNQQQGASTIDLFRYGSLRWKTISAGLVFLAIQVIYYSTTLNLGTIGYSRTINQEIVGVSEAVGYIGAEFIIHKVRRKRSSLIGLVSSSVLCLILAVLSYFKNDDNEELFKLISSGGLILNRFILCCFWAIFYVYIAEMYPTKVRSLGFGWSSAMGTIGSTMAPYMIFGSSQLNIDSWIPPGVIGLLCAISISCLKETKGLPLEDEIEELKNDRKH